MPDDCRVALDHRIADELDLARRQLEELAGRLCLDPVVFARHMMPLQQFDHLAQIIGEVARLLRRTGSADEAVGMIRLEAMRDRLIA